MGSTTPGGSAPDNARSTHGAEGSSPDTGPTSPDTRTFVMSHTRTSMEDADRWQETDVARALTAQAVTHGLAACTLVSTSSPGGSPARTSASPDAAPASPVNAPDCGGSSTESLSLFDPEPYSWRTWKGCCRPTEAVTSDPSWTRWSNSGMAWPGGCSTRSTSACPSGDAACSCSPSLADVLEPNAPPRYSLSPRAAAGIMRRAEARGRALPEALEAALQALSEVTHAPEATATGRW